MTTEDYKVLLPSLPADPGVYRFLGEEGVILYVGKAKNLKKRIASYFGEKKGRRKKTKLLVKQALNIAYTMVETEQDALLLEATLIKKYQPRYNIQLKDGKTYPYICIKNERFPRVFVTRRVIRDGSTYFGPYVSKQRVDIILELIKNLFPLRTCIHNLSKENIEKGKFKVCLEYHIKNCLGACVGYESEEVYNEKIAQIKNMLKGNFGAVKRHLQSEMEQQVENLNFEKAQETKVKLAAFNDYQGKSTVVSTTIKDVDVFSIATDEENAYVNYLKIIKGAIIHVYTLEMAKNLNEEEEDILLFAIQKLREKFHSITKEIILPFNIPFPDPEILITIPQIGDKKKLLELSRKNVVYFKLQKQKQEISQKNKQTPAERILKTMKEDLNMDVLPFHIECFDNSNIGGAFPVASCVVFKNGKPSKKDYRHFNIKTVVGPDDFASMEEVVGRRYKRLIEEKQPLPDLIIIDGGKGQLSSSVAILERLNILDKVTVIGIAKRLEEIFFPNDPVPLYINKKSESLKVIQHARNEAHRFAITFHRNQRSKNFTTTELTEIPGIGEKTAQKLLVQFKSVKRIKEAGYAELVNLIGKVAGQKVFKFFKNQSE